MSRSASFCAGAIALALAGCGSSAKPAGAPTPHMHLARLHPDGGPTMVEIPTPPAVRAAGGRELAEFNLGRKVLAETGCLACHKIGDNGNRGPGPNLTHVDSRLSPAGIERAILHPTPPMPSFDRMPAKKRRALVTFLSLLPR